jgi:hypothetical protein
MSLTTRRQQVERAVQKRMLEAGYNRGARIVELEDYSISAGASENLRWAPANCHMVLGRNEIALQDMERNIAAAAGMPLG